MRIACRKVTIFLFGLILAGCGVMPTGVGPTATAPQVQTIPQAVEIQIVDGDGRQTLVPADEEFASAAAALHPVLGSIHDQARTFFSPDRFAEEIEPIAHVYLRFDEEEKFTGQEIDWIAAELIIAQPAGEAMLLARATNIVDWSVYLPADPAAIEAFLNALTGP
jgi:hypothetical protein